jgi:hypothetical protein
MLRRLLAITAIWACLSIAWAALGGSVLLRTHRQDHALKTAVGQLWGNAQTQSAPQVYWEEEGGPQDRPGEPTRNYVPLDSSRLEVAIHLDPRRKGLLWYATYQVDFAGTYQVANPTGQVRDLRFAFALPAPEAVYDRFELRVGAEERPVAIDSGRMSVPLRLLPGQRECVRVSYRSQGLDEWWYRFGPGVERVDNFRLRMSTDFAEIDFPRQSLAPSREERNGAGWTLVWEYDRLLSGIHLGLLMPHPRNPGPWVGQLALAAPVSLFLFYFLLLLLATVRKVALHPVHYFLVGAAFFSFHLLLAYLADQLPLHLAFVIATAVSVGLVFSYMRLVVGWRFALVEVGLSQLVFLVLFSCAFFFEGYTGLATAVLGILTLFVAMQLTASVDWDRVFQDRANASRPT